MVKKAGCFAFAALILLSGCLPGLETDETADVEESDEDGADTVVEVSPEIPSLDSYYRSILQDGQYRHGATRGFSTSVVYNRMDLERLEVGLTELASDQFDPSSYFFSEGQFITRSDLNSWLRRYEEPEDEDDEGNLLGLNPPLGEGSSFEERERNSPRYLSHILEHNYVTENENGNLEIGGLAIGISLNSAYYFRERHDDGSYGPWFDEEIDEEVSLEEGQRIAQEVLERLRSEDREDGRLEDVPIVFALFREAPRQSSVPGEFIATAVADPGQDVGGWQTLNEAHYLFPSGTAENEQRTDAERFNQFSNDINRFFENYVGVVGNGYYQNDQMQRMEIEIPIRFYSKTEVIAFTQHVTDRVEQHFSPEIEVRIRVTASGEEEALIVREPDEEPYIHIH
ncbi:CamS family sex pheromone protein [Thalassobacillus sp. C254]|uniref:CamS family sex pheromone protein n=1 Tax=Thalassobacillus sp. C254 TaxID=1225341 RepID=UPI0006D2AF75|nr:CamS family sex pheromone protein [Thalassobacillus sp. C254]